MASSYFLASYFSYIRRAIRAVSPAMGTLDVLLTTHRDDWYPYYASLESFILDYRLTYVEHRREEIDTVFLAYLHAVQHALPSLPDTSKGYLFTILTHLLPDDESSWTRIHRVLDLMIRIRFPADDGARIVEKAAVLADRLTRAGSLAQKRVWIVTAVMDFYHAETPNALRSLQQLHFHALSFGTDDAIWYHTIFYTWRRIRQRESDVDTYVRSVAVRVLADLRDDRVKLAQARHIFYVEYVRYLDDPTFFQGLYTAVSRESVCPFTHELSMPDFRVNLTSQNPLEKETRDGIATVVSQVYSKMRSFTRELNLSEPAVDLHRYPMYVYLFDHRTAYKDFVPLWNVRSDTAGYAQWNLRMPDQRFEMFTFKDGNGDYRNLGHEVMHILSYVWFGPRFHWQVPAWFLEGLASYLGNDFCHHEESRYLTQRLADVPPPRVDRILHLQPAHGLDLYHFGSLLTNYLFVQQTPLLTELLTEVRQDTMTPEIFRARIAESVNHTYFSSWFVTHQDVCEQERLYQKEQVLVHLREALLAKDTQKSRELVSQVDFEWVDVNTLFARNETVLHTAIRAGDLGVMWSLLHRGADWEIRNSEGQTPPDVDPDNWEVRFHLDHFIRAHRSTPPPSEKEAIQRVVENAQDFYLRTVLPHLTTSEYNVTGWRLDPPPNTTVIPPAIGDPNIATTASLLVLLLPLLLLLGSILIGAGWWHRSKPKFSFSRARHQPLSPVEV